MHLRISGPKLLHARGSVAPELGKLHRPVGGKLALHEVYITVQLLLGTDQKALIIRAQHHNVQIIVPWDKPVMAHRAERRAGKELIADTVFFADGVQILQHGQQQLLVFIANMLISSHGGSFSL